MQKAYFTFFFLLVFTFTYAQDSILDKRISIDYTNTQVRIILKDISEKYDIKFAYSDKQIDLNQTISISLDDQPIWKVFNELFVKNGIEYKLVQNQIILTPLKKRHQITLSGYIREKDSKELLVGANIYISSLQLGISTNNYGFYSFNVPIGNDSVEICYSLVGYENKCKKIYLVADQQEEISLTPIILDEVIVTSDKIEKASEIPQMSQITLSPQQVKGLPALMGEKDVMKIIQLMPGVQRGVEGTTGLFVRGGGSDQNLIILDDAVVYNVSHLFGFMSVFNGDAIKSIEFTKGGFPARFGGRLSSVLELTMKDGNKEKFHGEGNVGLVSSSFTLEGPLKKGKSSFIISGRRTYFDLLLKPILPNDDNFRYYFYDLNAKLNYDFGTKNKLYLSGYFGRDFYQRYYKKYEVENKDYLNWGNATATLRWNHLFSQKVFMNTSLIFTDYKLSVTADTRYYSNSQDRRSLLTFSSHIQDFSLKSDIHFTPGIRNQMKAGFLLTNHLITPDAVVVQDELIDLKKSDQIQTNAIESAVYVEDDLKVSNHLRTNLGLRATSFSAVKNKINLEPRASAVYQLSNYLSLKASYALMNQYIQLLSNTSPGMPTDLWVPSSEKIIPQQSHQIALGLVKDLPLHGITFSLEGYYKKMNHIINYKEGSSFVSGLDYISMQNSPKLEVQKWEDKVTQGQGWAYGAEFLAEKKEGRLTGWVGYTLSWTQVQFNEINLGKKFYPRYDHRHSISITGIYQWKKNITLSATWVFSSGGYMALPLSFYNNFVHDPSKSSNWYNKNQVSYDSRLLNIEYADRNTIRMAPYHRLDVGIQFHKKKKWGERIWDISIYNAYCRFNPMYYNLRYDNKNNKYILERVFLFPVIPSISYRFKF